jgi:hypothetical protein
MCYIQAQWKGFSGKPHSDHCISCEVSTVMDGEGRVESNMTKDASTIIDYRNKRAKEKFCGCHDRVLSPWWCHHSHHKKHCPHYKKANFPQAAHAKKMWLQSRKLFP